MRNRDYVTAVRYFDKLGKLTLSDDRLAKAAGFSHLQLGNQVLALKFFHASIRARAAQADVHAALGDIYVERADQDKALRHLRRAVELESGVSELQYKLGLALIGFYLWNEALEVMRKAVALNPQYLQGHLGLARVLTELRYFDEAEVELEQAGAVAPGVYAVPFRLGKLREKQQQFEAAIASYQQAEAQSEHAAPVCEALALAELANGDPKAALDTFSRGLKQNPTDTALLRHATELRYEMGDPNAFSHYDAAIRNENAQAAHAEYVLRLAIAERTDEAERQLQSFESNYGRGLDWMSLSAELHYDRAEYDAVIKLLDKAPADNQVLMVWKAKAMLGSADVVGAQSLLTHLRQEAPRDQYLLALLSTCYRLNDSDAYAELVDYENLVVRKEIVTPPGFGNLASFNQALLETLQELHVTKANPLSQSVIGGTQTPGNLLEQPHPVIVALNQAFRDTLARELAGDFYKNLSESHPVRMGEGVGVVFPAAWSIWVTEGGYHRTHVHTHGWYSSAYYVSLPSDMKATGTTGPEGVLQFGRPGLNTPDMLEADHVVLPAEGTLVLFPSYFWHGTVPFKGEEPRVTVAFDAVPKV